MVGAEKQKRLFCFGYGYVSDYLGYALQESDDGWTIGGTTGDEERRRELLERRIRARIFDEEHPISDARTLFNRFSHLLICTPPNDDGSLSFNLHAEDLINLPNLEWVGFLSSGVVYGDRNGGEVDETSEVMPTSQRGSRRAKAEEQWLSLYRNYGLPVHIFRLAGIYGPGRSALDSVRVGVARRIDKPGHVFNRIHVEDIIQVLKASFANPNPGSIYNVADDHPAPSHEVITYACNLLGLSVPPLAPFHEADLSPIAQSFYKDNKRVRNDKIKTELGIQLKYPDFKAGIDGCLAAEKHAENSQLKTS